MSGRWRAATTAALAAMALGAAPGAPAAPDPAGGSPAQLLTELQRLHRELGEATETYQATARTLAERRARNKRLGTGLAKARVALAEGRDAAGQLARRQYQGVVEVSPRSGCCWPPTRRAPSTRSTCCAAPPATGWRRWSG